MERKLKTALKCTVFKLYDVVQYVEKKSTITPSIKYIINFWQAIDLNGFTFTKFNILGKVPIPNQERIQIFGKGVKLK